MINYKKWKEKHLSVTNLFLDSLNPRIPEAHEGLSQNELISELVEYDNVYDLSKKIANDGYYPIESLIGVVKNNKKIILEGNRRLAALKLFINPDLAPEAFRRKFKHLSEHVNIKDIRKVRVLLAPSRTSVSHIILTRHTKSQIEEWKPIQKAKFYKQLINSGLTIGEISQQYTITEREIAEQLQSYNMYNVACSLELPNEILEKVENTRKFPMSTLDRMYRYSQVQKFLGIKFDESKNLKGSIKPEEFKKGFRKILTDIATGDLDSRTVNNEQDVEKYLKSFGKQKPNLGKRAKFTIDDLVSKRVARKSQKRQKPKKQKKKKRRYKSLIPRRFKCDIENQRIFNVFNELKKLHVDKFPNAVSIMFRSLLEMSIQYYLSKSGQLKPIIEKEKRRQKNLPKKTLCFRLIL